MELLIDLLLVQTTNNRLYHIYKNNCYFDQNRQFLSFGLSGIGDLHLYNYQIFHQRKSLRSFFIKITILVCKNMIDIAIYLLMPSALQPSITLSLSSPSGDRNDCFMDNPSKAIYFHLIYKVYPPYV